MARKETKEQYQRMEQCYIDTRNVANQIKAIEKIGTNWFSKNQLIKNTTLGHSRAELIINNMIAMGLVEIQPQKDKPPLFRIATFSKDGIVGRLEKRKQQFQKKIQDLQMEMDCIEILQENIQDIKSKINK